MRIRGSATGHGPPRAQELQEIISLIRRARHQDALPRERLSGAHEDRACASGRRLISKAPRQLRRSVPWPSTSTSAQPSNDTTRPREEDRRRSPLDRLRICGDRRCAPPAKTPKKPALRVSGAVKRRIIYQGQDPSIT